MGALPGGAEKWGGRAQSLGRPSGEACRLPCRDVLSPVGRFWSMSCRMPCRTVALEIVRSLRDKTPNGDDRPDAVGNDRGRRESR